jgi:ferritin
MLPEKVENILNLQIEREDYSSQLYLSMASWAENIGFEGVSKWFYAQAEEERLHMLKLVRYVNEREGKAVIPGIETPPKEFGDIFEVFKKVLAHEKFISGSINEIVAVCIAENDFTTQSWIQWFVNEQIEEESGVKALLDKLNLLGKTNLYLFDRDIMSMRTASDAADTTA